MQNTRYCAVLLLPLAAAGCQTLHDAGRRGDVKAVKLLLEQGADVNARDKVERTPLHWAACMGHTALAELLLSQGADVNAEDQVGLTPLQLAILTRNAELADLLLKHGAKESTAARRLVEARRVLVSVYAQSSQIEPMGVTRRVDDGPTDVIYPRPWPLDVVEPLLSPSGPRSAHQDTHHPQGRR